MTPRNALLHGDCLALLPRLPGESVDFMLTDPPYLAHYRARPTKQI
jgi:DNA modification methylase